ncbi:MAG: formylmethanofuran dehydrogenase subunit C [Gemmatimonadales bacterium]
MTREAILTLRAPLRQRVDASTVSWGTLPGLDAIGISAQEIWVEGEGSARLGDLFDIRGAPAPRIRLLGDLALLDGIGTGLAAGEIIVEGDAGWYLGRGMSGGLIEVRGNVGPHAGAAEPGAKRGITGGEIIVRCSAGRQLGAGLRRGLIVVEGDADAGAGRAMLAGSIVVFGRIGPDPGLWSKRGSIVVFGALTPPASYRYACTYRPPHLSVTLMYLKARRGVPITPEQLTGLYRRYSGDLAELGAGEILAWIP